MIAVVALMILFIRYRTVTSGMVAVVQLILPTIGFSILEGENGSVAGDWLVQLAPLVFAAGMILYPRVTAEAAGAAPVHHSTRGNDTLMNRVRHLDFAKVNRFLFFSLWVLGALAVLHFLLGGIPVLSADVETQRFSLGASGLGGFPSRAVMYCIPAVALIALATITRSTMRMTIAVWILYVVTQLLLGFKGALIEVVTTAIIGYLVRVRKPRKAVLLWLLVAAGLGALYVNFIASLYTTMAETSGGFDYIVRRATVGAIEAGYDAMRDLYPAAPDGPVFWHDLTVLLQRYTGTATQDGYTFDTLASSMMTGTPLGAGYFIVPVTVGGAVYLLFSTSPLISLAILLALGWLWSKAVAWLRVSASLKSIIIGALLLAGIRIFVLNGNGAYLLINLTFSAAIMLAIGALSRLGRRRGAFRQSGVAVAE